MPMAGRLLSPSVTATDVEQSVSFGRRITELAQEHPDALALVFAPTEGDEVPVTFSDPDVGPGAADDQARAVADRVRAEVLGA